MDRQRRLGGTGTGLANDGLNPAGHQFGGGACGDFRFTGVIFNQQFDGVPGNAAFVVDLLGNQLGRLQGRQTIGGEVVTVGCGKNRCCPDCYAQHRKDGKECVHSHRYHLPLLD